MSKTLADFERRLNEVAEEFGTSLAFERDNDGQIVAYTGLTEDAFPVKPQDDHDKESTGPLLAIFITTENGLFVASHPVENDDVEQAATIWHEQNGEYPERVLIVENGEHPDEGCYDLVSPVVIKDYNIDEDGKAC